LRSLCEARGLCFNGSMTARKIIATVFLIFATNAVHGDAKQASSLCENTQSRQGEKSGDITASTDGVLLDGNQHMIFYYVLHNSGQQDYTIPSAAAVRLFALLAKPKGGSKQLSESDIWIVYPIIVHPGQGQIILLRDLVHTYAFDDHLKNNPTPAEYHNYEIAAKAAIRKSWPGLNGFRLCDTASQRVIILPRPF
jgi:hypothetical protein